MRGASARSLHQTLAAVDEAVTAGAEAAGLGDDLFSIADVLDTRPALRRVLTDPSTPERAKADLAEGLFGGKVSDGAVSVVRTAATSRWNSTLDLGDAIEVAGATAYVAGAEADDALDDVEDELFRFGQVVKGDADLRTTLADRTIAVQRRRDLITSLLEGKVTTTSLALTSRAAVIRRRSFESALRAFGEIVADRRGRLVATVTTAYALSEDELQRLAAALADIYDRTVHLNEVVDTSVLGGVSVEVGAERIDGTMASRVDDARRHIAG